MTIHAHISTLETRQSFHAIVIIIKRTEDILHIKKSWNTTNHTTNHKTANNEFLLCQHYADNKFQQQ